MSSSTRFIGALCCAIFITFLTLSWAAAEGFPLWQTNGVGVCTAGGDQQVPQLTSDGAGGAIITWHDRRGGTYYNIYAQRVDSTGQSIWQSDGVSLCTSTWDQTYPKIASDELSDAIVAWRDNRSSIGDDIYAQRVDANGDVLWGTDGVSVCIATNLQWYLQMSPDGSGGAVVTWFDRRRNGSDEDLYAQRVDADGTAVWNTGGVSLCAGVTNIGGTHRPVSDGSGGAIVAWHDDRSGPGYDIYAQRVDADGNIVWQTNGVSVCTASLVQEHPEAAPDGSGGAIVTWQDTRSGVTDIYAQKLDSDGNTLWQTDGVTVCGAANTQEYPRIVTDGSAGAIITWRDDRSSSHHDIYAQRIDHTGNVLWQTDGVGICMAASNQQIPEVISDGSGGAIIAWEDDRTGPKDIYAQRVDADGNTLWATNGVSVCYVTGTQDYPRLVHDSGGGAIVVWQDNRGTSQDVYAQRVGDLLAISKSAQDLNGSPLYVGDSISYTVVVTNQSVSDVASNLIVSDTIPDGVSFESASPSYSGPNPLVWNVSSLSAGATWTGTITASVDGTSDPISANVASVACDEMSLRETGPTAAWDVANALTITKTAQHIDGEPLLVEDVIQYFLTVTNEGATTSGVQVTDTLPSGVTFISATGSYAGPSPLIWNVGTLDVTETWTATVAVNVDGTENPIGGNVASASSDQVSLVETDGVYPPGGGDVMWPVRLPLVMKNL